MSLFIPNIQIIPPPEFSAGTTPLSKDFLVNVSQQTIKKLDNYFEVTYDNKKKITYGEFNTKASKLDEDINITGKTDSDIENEFWDSLRRSRKTKLYSIENAISLFPKKCLLWNLNGFTAKESLIHGKVCISVTDFFVRFHFTIL